MTRPVPNGVKYPAPMWYGRPVVCGPGEVYFDYGREENLHRLARCFMASIRPDDEPVSLDTFTHWDSSLTPAERAVGEALLELFYESANAGLVQPPPMTQEDEDQ